MSIHRDTMLSLIVAWAFDLPADRVTIERRRDDARCCDVIVCRFRWGLSTRVAELPVSDEEMAEAPIDNPNRYHDRAAIATMALVLSCPF